MEAATTKVCPDCAEQVQEAAKVCRFCGYRFDLQTPGAQASTELAEAQLRAKAAEKPKGVGNATWLGLLITGVGNFYLGEVGRGFVFLGSAIMIALGLSIGGAGYLALLVSIASAIDANRGAKLYNATGRTRRVTWGLWVHTEVRLRRRRRDRIPRR